MEEQIGAELERLERERGITILYAVESGSRAWGFASPDSDYDVRFVYHRAVTDYLRIDPKDDVIELPLHDELDISGWDLFKALALFRASNPPLLEWLHSPIIYRENGALAETLRTLAQTHYSPRRMMYHYLSMAKKNFRLNIADRDAVSLKKYLYVIRPLLCFQWIERNGAPPPTLFAEVRAGTEIAQDVNTRLEALLERKQQAKETEKSMPDTTLDAFIVAELARAETVVGGMPDNRMDAAPLNAIAWEVMGF